MPAEMLSSVINDLVDFTLEKSKTDFREKNAKHVKHHHHHHRHGKHCRHKLKARGLATDVNVSNSSMTLEKHLSGTEAYEKSPCVKHRHHRGRHSNTSVGRVTSNSRTTEDDIPSVGLGPDVGKTKASVVAEHLANVAPTQELNTWQPTLDEDDMYARVWNAVYNLPAEHSEETASVGCAGGGSIIRCHPNHIFAPITSPNAYSVDDKLSWVLSSSDRASSKLMSSSSLPDDVAPTALPSRSPSPRNEGAEISDDKAEEDINYSTANDDNDNSGCGRNLDEYVRSLTSLRRHTSDGHVAVSSVLRCLRPLISNVSATADGSRNRKRKSGTKSTRTSSSKKTTTSSMRSGGRQRVSRSRSSSQSGGVRSHQHKTNRPLSLTASSSTSSRSTSSTTFSPSSIKAASSPPSVIITGDCVTPSRVQTTSGTSHAVRKRSRAKTSTTGKGGASKKADESKYVSPPPFGRISINLDVVVRDETHRESRIHPMHFMVDCPMFKVERIFVNGRAFH